MVHENGDIGKIRDFITQNKKQIGEARKAVKATISLIHKRLGMASLKDIEKIKALEIACRYVVDPAMELFQDFADLHPISCKKDEKELPPAKRPEYIG